MVAHLAWDEGVARSNRVIRTIFGDLRTFAEALSDCGTTLVVVVVQELPLMESKPVKVLGRPAKTDAPFWG